MCSESFMNEYYTYNSQPTTENYDVHKNISQLNKTIDNNIIDKKIKEVIKGGYNDIYEKKYKKYKSKYLSLKKN